MRKKKIFVSGCVITYNNEKTIKNCLNSLRGCVDEIIIVDGYSRDKTVKICKTYTKKIYFCKEKRNFAKIRNFALSKATGDWILFIDADEVLSKELREFLLRRSFIYNDKYDAYAFSRRKYALFKGKKLWIRHGIFYPDWQVRLFRNKPEYIYRICT